MDNTDLSIVKQEQHREKSKHKNIYQGEVWINEQALLFTTARLFENTVAIMLPESYDDMPLAVAKIKYPMEQRPMVIKTSADTTVNFAFNLFRQAPFSNQEVEKVVTDYWVMMQKHLTSAKYHDLRFFKEQDIYLGFYDYTSPGLDGDLYQLSGYAPVDQCLFHFMFNCPAGQKEEWQPILAQVMRSIRNCHNRRLEEPHAGLSN